MLFETQPFKIYKVKTSADEYGGVDESLELIALINGFLDMMSYSDRNANINSIVVNATHCLIAKYDSRLTMAELRGGVAEQVQTGRRFSIDYIDDVADQHDHLEIYLEMIDDD